MKVVLQRVKEGGVYIESKKYTTEIEKGFVILLGIKVGDKEEDAFYLADKCSNLRIFEDENEKMNLSIKDVKGEALVISQFTLYGDASKGNRPSFIEAERPEKAESLYKIFVKRLKDNIGSSKVTTGVFGAMMDIKIINDGPVTIIIDSK
ncbi:MAG: D-tyrosyl-tRNA(Tyr) deacylase [Bacteroidetes bacterium]|nr:D-tyrosyl-tRNA(Tyr) deacylase [Bacteroidota bacterium]